MRTIDADVLKGGFEEDGHLSPYIEEFIDACPTVGGWISVKDRLPNDPRFVLVYVKHPESSSFPAWSCIMTDMWLGDRWAENTDEEAHEVTHWMPLPEAPKEE